MASILKTNKTVVYFFIHNCGLQGAWNGFEYIFFLNSKHSGPTEHSAEHIKGVLRGKGQGQAA